ncbi:MAG: stage II sporulation protein P [Bacteroides sp.]|nr:stage II sporulation protein P [Eubacterium sp.]MCM1418056.1 stage II sporulation protein P [Roseburia sp.]MCM1462200.1 stage II sporulation protein P [Bacteroides sp.]
MRIIKTVVKKSGLRGLLAGGVLTLAPILSILASEVMPDAVRFMTEAARFSVYPLSDPRDVNNGSLILYKPLPAEESAPEEAKEVERSAPSTEKKEAAFLSRNISDTDEDLSVFSEHSGLIRETTFTANGGTDFIDLPEGGQIRNCTELSAETVYREATSPHGISLELYSDEPQVLILHTHTNESYEPSEKGYYDESYTCRSEDPENSVVSVGTAIAEELASAGIAVLHDGTIHDDRYTGAYTRSYETTVRLLNEFPSIKIILDVHRDAVEEEDGTRVSAVTEIDGKKAAQFMIISAADDGSYDIPNYLENLRFASALQQAVEARYPTLSRPILFQYCQYNQQLSVGSLLIEVGSHGNSIDQAVYTGRLIGRSLAAMFAGDEIPVSTERETVPRFFIDLLR